MSESKTTKPLTKFQTQFYAAHRTSTPLVCVRTFDAQTTIASVKGALGVDLDKSALLRWDAAQGYRIVEATTKSMNQSYTVIDRFVKVKDLGIDATVDLTTALYMAAISEQTIEPSQHINTVVFLVNAHLWWSDPVRIQAIWNLRDLYKTAGNTLVMLASPGATLPIELQPDTLVLEEPLPTRNELGELVTEVYGFTAFSAPNAETVDKATNALIGLPMFPAEQAIAMSINMDNGELNIGELWTRKHEAINSTPGLHVWETSDGFDKVGGLSSIKTFLTGVMKGKEPPTIVLFTDEIEKAFAGSGKDHSPVMTELTGSMLSFTTDNDIDGIMFNGVQGSGKSQLIKNLAGEFGTPVIEFNVAAMQGSLVGQSGQQIRTAQQMVLSVAGAQANVKPRILWAATSNNFDALPSELRDRFQLGQFFFDLPDMEERTAIWQVYRTRYNIPADEPTPNDTGWNGRSIRECCKKAYRLNCPLAMAAQYVIPVSTSAADTIARIRDTAHGKYLSASMPGVYNKDATMARQNANTGASVNMPQGRKLR